MRELCLFLWKFNFYETVDYMKWPTSRISQSLEPGVRFSRSTIYIELVSPLGTISADFSVNANVGYV